MIDESCWDTVRGWFPDDGRGRLDLDRVWYGSPPPSHVDWEEEGWAGKGGLRCMHLNMSIAIVSFILPCVRQAGRTTLPFLRWAISEKARGAVVGVEEE